MLILARFIGVVIIGMGMAIASNPKIFAVIINFWKHGKRIYMAGIVRLAFGAIFLSVAPRCRLPLIVSVLGALMVLGGITIFILGPARIQKIFIWWEKRPPLLMRVMGVVALAIGALILYSV